jgi:hypothetical protein
MASVTLSKPGKGAELSRADAEAGRTARLCGVQIVGALAHSGVLDLGGETPVIRYVPETKTKTEKNHGNENRDADEPKSPGFAVTGWTSEFLCLGATTCLMEAGSTSGRPLHAAAASLLGLALAQRREALARAKGASARAGSADPEAEEEEEEEEEDFQAAAFKRKPLSAEPRWCATLRRRLRSLYDRGPQDAFATAAERIARRDPEWLAESADGAILAQLHQLFPRLHGEPRFVAIHALARVAAADAARGAAFAERALTSSVDGLEALLSTRDAQVHALAMRALADALPGVAAEHARWPRGKKMDLDAWRRAAMRAERSLWNADDGATRDAHVAFCAALAKAAPSLADLPAVRAPLLRAVVDGHPGGEDAARRDAALEYWDARLPGAGARVPGGDERFESLSAAPNPFGARLRAALGVLPTGSSNVASGSENAATRATATGWLAATCDVVLSVPRKRRESFFKPLCDADLAKCEFRDAVVDVAWQGASLPMAPLFSTHMTLASQATQYPGAFGNFGGHGTQVRDTTHGTNPVSLASSASEYASAQNAQPGVLATPVAFAGDSTFATQFGGASLSSRVKRRVKLGEAGRSVRSWARRKPSSLLGCEANNAEDSNRRTARTRVTRSKRRFGALSASAAGRGRPFTSADENSAAAFSKASAAERRRRFERERALGRRRAVKLVRQYRAGELPDVRAATPAALLDPLAALARRDKETASALLTALLDAALAAEASEAEKEKVGEKRKATETVDADAQEETERKRNGASPERETLRDGVRRAVAALLENAASADPTLAAWALRAAAADPEARFDADAVRAAAFDGGCLASGVLALEARALAARGAKEETSTSTHHPEAAGADYASAREKKGSDAASVWDALAALHRASGDDVAARLCLARAFDGLEASDARATRTRAALTAQLEGDAASARDIYDALLRDDADADADPDADETVKRRLARLWFRERARCSQRLGEWDELAFDLAESVPPPWSVERLRSGTEHGDGERAIPGAAAGGDALCFATRALARASDAFPLETQTHAKDASLDGSLDAILGDVACAPLGSVAAELGVELATVRLQRGLEDAVVAHVAAIRARFAERWAVTPAAATFARRALLQPLQAATELEEVLWAVRACRAGETRETRERKSNRLDGLDGLENRLPCPMEDVTKRWSNRWPSASRDPPEAWERVEWVRRSASRAFAIAVPRSYSEAWSACEASPHSRRRAVEALVRAAKGMRRAGEMHAAYERLARAKALLTEGGRLAPADDSWLVQKAVVKLRLAQADAPRAFGVDGARVAQHEEDRARASLLRGVLRSLTRVQRENSLKTYKEAEAEVASCVGALASRLARLDPEGVFFPGGTGSRTDAAVSAFAGDEPRRAGELVELACVEYARAATLARRRAEAFEKTIGAAGRTSPRDGTATNAARAAAKASLRFALHCEATLSSLSSSSSALGNEASLSLGLGASSSFPPPSARGGGSDATAENAFHPEGLEPTLTRHALLALAGGAGARARHLIPRVLALLRGDGDRERASAAAAAEFARLAPRVPSWLFLEWIPQLYSLLDAPGPGGDAAAATVSTLARSYPSAAYAEHRVARAEFSKLGAARCARHLDATLASPAGEAFARAVTLLDFPAQRLAWWRAHVKLLVAGAVEKASAAGGAANDDETRAAAEAAFAAAEAALLDVGEPDEPNLGALNRRFAQLAKGPLSRAISEARKRLHRAHPSANTGVFLEACKALAANVADAERTTLERWRSSSGAAATEARPRLALAHFSRWFAAFDGETVRRRSRRRSRRRFLAQLACVCEIPRRRRDPRPVRRASGASVCGGARVSGGLRTRD